MTIDPILFWVLIGNTMLGWIAALIFNHGWGRALREWKRTLDLWKGSIDLLDACTKELVDCKRKELERGDSDVESQGIPGSES